MQGLLGLLMLLHLAGVFHPPQGQPAQKPQQKPSPKPQPGPRGLPQAQGAAGIGQGFKGSQGPVIGGLGSMQNSVGLHPHQLNPSPYTWMAGVR